MGDDVELVDLKIGDDTFPTHPKVAAHVADLVEELAAAKNRAVEAEKGLQEELKYRETAVKDFIEGKVKDAETALAQKFHAAVRTGYHGIQVVEAFLRDIFKDFPDHTKPAA